MIKQLSYNDPVGVETVAGMSNDPGEKRLLPRPYPFPATGHSERDLSVQIEHEGTGYFFPLGTSNIQTAAVRAREIDDMAANNDWEFVCRHFSRELIISFEWCMDPVLWTYTTIHTLVGNGGRQKSNSLSADASRQPVMVVEAEAGIRQALCWGIDQKEGFVSVPCDSVESCLRLMAVHKPRLVFLNRNVGAAQDFKSSGPAGRMQSGTPVVTYSAYADGSQMFASAPGGVGGYLIKRVKPDRLLEPIVKAVERSDWMRQDFLLPVKYYFQELLQVPIRQENPALARLTQRERATLELLSKGCVDKEIAQAMGISPWTVHGHIKKIFERLNVRTRTEAVIRYLER